MAAYASEDHSRAVLGGGWDCVTVALVVITCYHRAPGLWKVYQIIEFGSGEVCQAAASFFNFKQLPTHPDPCKNFRNEENAPRYVLNALERPFQLTGGRWLAVSTQGLDLANSQRWHSRERETGKQITGPS